MSPHADTALDQLRLADDFLDEPTREQLWESARTAAVVHAVLALADEVRRAQPPLYEVMPAKSSPAVSVKTCGATGWAINSLARCGLVDGHRGRHAVFTAT